MRKPQLCTLSLVGLFLCVQLAEATELVYQKVHQLTAFWDFNSATPLVDKFGNGYTLTNSGTTFIPPTASVNGWLPDEFTSNPLHGSPTQVAQFSGGQFLGLPAAAYTAGNSFTFIAAQRNDLGAPFETLLASSRFRYQNVGDTLQGAINGFGGTFGGPPYPLTHDAWYFIALTYDIGSQVLNSYAVTLSGTLGAPVLVGSAVAPGLGNMTGIRFGGDGTSGIGGFDGLSGQMDFIGWHDGLLTPTELQLALDDFVNGPQLIPEPSSVVLLGLGLVGLAVKARRRRRAA